MHLGASWGLGASRVHLEAVLGASWGRLGASWGRLGRVLGSSWGVLGASWGPLGASWSKSVAAIILEASKIEKSFKN